MRPFSALGVDRCGRTRYNGPNCIGQFVTILSVNKTRELDGRIALIFYWDGCVLRPFFIL